MKSKKATREQFYKTVKQKPPVIIMMAKVIGTAGGVTLRPGQIEAHSHLASPLTGKITVVIRWPNTIGGKIALAKAIVAAMTANATNFPTPVPSLAALTTIIAAVETANSQAKTRVFGAAESRNALMRTMILQFNLERNYVYSVCVANLPNALAIAQSAMMDLKRTSTGYQRPFTVTQLASGSVELSSGLGGRKRGTHQWGVSTNTAVDANWYVIPITETTKGKTIVSSLTPGTHYFFRHLIILRSGPTAYEYVDLWAN